MLRQFQAEIKRIELSVSPTESLVALKIFSLETEWHDTALVLQFFLLCPSHAKTKKINPPLRILICLFINY